MSVVTGGSTFWSHAARSTWPGGQINHVGDLADLAVVAGRAVLVERLNPRVLGDLEDRALHLLQATLVHINTLLLQQVLAEPEWASRLTDADLRGLTPLFWSNINPYGTFHLDMDTWLDLALVAA